MTPKPHAIELPTCFLYTWNKTSRCHLTELNTRKTELTDIALWTASNLATVVKTDRVGILWNSLKFASGLISLAKISRSSDNLFQSRALFSVTCNEFCAFYLTGFH